MGSPKCLSGSFNKHHASVARFLKVGFPWNKTGFTVAPILGNDIYVVFAVTCYKTVSIDLNFAF